MIVPIIEAMVFACAGAVARTPARQRRQAPRRVLSGHIADQLIAALETERSRTAALRDKNAALVLKGIRDQAEIDRCHRQLVAATKLFRAHGLA